MQTIIRVGPNASTLWEEGEEGEEGEEEEEDDSQIVS
jgi:hypothetical protein